MIGDMQRRFPPCIYGLPSASRKLQLSSDEPMNYSVVLFIRWLVVSLATNGSDDGRIAIMASDPGGIEPDRIAQGMTNTAAHRTTAYLRYPRL